MCIRDRAGNVAVAAYGVVANFALVATAIFNGVAQGAQPLVSECYGKSDKAGARKPVSYTHLFFMCNYIVSAFVRNDGDPSLAMVATLSSSLFNVVFDYIFMFPIDVYKRQGPAPAPWPVRPGGCAGTPAAPP